MPLEPHERAIKVFRDLFNTKIQAMGLSQSLILVGTAKHTYNGWTK